MGLLGGLEKDDNGMFPCLRGDWYNKMDDCPLIWTDFSRHNYVTGYTEDWPQISAFNSEKTGFVQQPTDYYYRTITTAQNSQHGEKLKCVGGKAGLTETESHLKYVKDFWRVMKVRIPFFLFSFFTRISHNSLNTLKVSVLL